MAQPLQLVLRNGAKVQRFLPQQAACPAFGAENLSHGAAAPGLVHGAVQRTVENRGGAAAVDDDEIVHKPSLLIIQNQYSPGSAG